MSIGIKNELAEFHCFVGEQLANGGAQLSPEKVLAMWRERADAIAAIREGLDAVDAGQTKPLNEFVHDFQKRHDVVNEE